MAEPIVFLFATTEDGEPRYRLVDTHPRDDESGHIAIEERDVDAMGEATWNEIPRRGGKFSIPYPMMLAIIRRLRPNPKGPRMNKFKGKGVPRYAR